MKKQLESKHILNQGYMMYNDSNPRIFKCKLCPNHKAVSQLKKLNIHLKLIHPESNNKIVQCLACTENNLFKSIKALFTHVQEFHRRLYQPFRCNFCDAHPGQTEYRNRICNAHSSSTSSSAFKLSRASLTTL